MTTDEYFKKCVTEFVYYLNDNDHFNEENAILKKDAKRLYLDFKKKNKIRLNFFNIMPYISKMFLERPRNKEGFSVLIFKESKLKNLLMQPRSTTEIEIEDKISIADVRKKTIVSQNIAFKKNKTKEAFLSERECKYCDIQFKNKSEYEVHIVLSVHKFRRDFFSTIDLQKANANLKIIELSVNSFDIENIILRQGTRQNLTILAKNISNIKFEIEAIQSSPSDTVSIKATCPITVNPSLNAQFVLTVEATEIGIICHPLVFYLKIDNKLQLFAAELIFFIHDEILDSLHPISLYKRNSKAAVVEFTEPIDLPDNLPKKGKSGSKPVIPLGKYPFSPDLMSLLNNGLKKASQSNIKQQELLTKVLALLNVEDKSKCLTPKNYIELLDLLLLFEEHQMKKDIRDYDCDNQELVKLKSNGLYKLEVAGLAEQRPSILLGDIVTVRMGKNNTKPYGGYVHKVEETSVHLEFSHAFNNLYQPNMKFFVSFGFNRYCLRTEHQALELAKKDNIAHIFFPKKISNKALPPNIELNWFNAKIATNREQKQAVYAILNTTSLPHPYLIFGPPGTGKTMTVVEAIKQVHKLTKKYILVCAPSNNAADEITKRLSSLPTTDLFRYFAQSYPFRKIDPSIRKYSNFNSEDSYQDSLSNFRKYRIIVTTLVTAARLINYQQPKNHFGYIFIDESGQATETETLIPIAGILSQQNTLSGQIVLAGDPEQLGPIIHSTQAKQYGFGTSMLERLIRTVTPYMRNEEKYNSSAVTKLINNYRSHEAIINVPNRCFYDGELIAAGDSGMINVALNSEILPNKKIPVIFHNVVGIDQREGNSPSFFNLAEIDVVLSYLNRLIGEKLSGMKILADHIGIIAPYKKQVQKLTKACEKKRYGPNMLIGSVEQFQGQERLIIIISTVRSKPNFIQYDNQFYLGFLNNPKRFNVAMTRAKALLIVIGNANILQGDKHWKSFLQFCIDNKATSGKKFNLSEEIEVEISEALSNLSLNGNNNNEDGPNFSRGQQ